ncbi:MAG: hypothetical protein WKF93_05370, partial [Acidimicrobiales bacterium]
MFAVRTADGAPPTSPAARLVRSGRTLSSRPTAVLGAALAVAMVGSLAAAGEGGSASERDVAQAAGIATGAPSADPAVGPMTAGAPVPVPPPAAPVTAGPAAPAVAPPPGAAPPGA